MAENVIGKNLDNITNVAKGLDKEFLDMTYPDKYYRDVINPAKLGKGPMPSRMEMLSKFQPGKAMRIGIDPYLPNFMGGGKYAAERAKPTAAASKFLNTLGAGAKFLGKKVGPLGILDIFTPTKLGADDIVTQEMRDSIDTTGINSLRGDYTRAPNAAFADLLSDIDKFDRSPASSGVRETIGSRITEGLGSIADKVGGGLEFLKNLSPVQNIINAVKRGDESTRGVAGLNVNDVFNINTFGTEEDPTKDPYGINIVSARGDYNEYVKNLAEKHKQMKFKTDSGKRRKQFYADAAEKIRAEERRKEEIAQRAFLASQNRGGDGPQNNPQGGLGRQDYSRAATADFASLADEMGIDYR